MIDRAALIRRLLDDELLTIQTTKDAATVIREQERQIAQLEDKLAAWTEAVEALCTNAAARVTLRDLQSAGLTIDLRPG